MDNKRKSAFYQVNQPRPLNISLGTAGMTMEMTDFVGLSGAIEDSC